MALNDCMRGDDGVEQRGRRKTYRSTQGALIQGGRLFDDKKKRDIPLGKAVSAKRRPCGDFHRKGSGEREKDGRELADKDTR